MKTRNCEACGKSQTGKKVWEKHGQKVICMACGPMHWFDVTGQLHKRQASLGNRLGFQPLNSRTHGYNGQEHR